MKKLYIALAVIFVLIAIGLIVFSNSRSATDDEAMKVKIEENFKKSGPFKSGNMTVVPKIKKQLNKNIMKKMIMIKSKEKKPEQEGGETHE